MDRFAPICTRLCAINHRAFVHLPSSFSLLAFIPFIHIDRPQGFCMLPCEERIFPMLLEEQIAERQARAENAIAKMLDRPRSGIYGDYHIRSGSRRTYRIALRGPSLFEKFCSCPDFAINTLGTCKHIEGLFLRLRNKHGSGLQRARFSRDRASLSLHYGGQVRVRLRLPDAPSTALAIANDQDERCDHSPSQDQPLSPH
jgi:hypothetical protein